MRYAFALRMVRPRPGCERAREGVRDVVGRARLVEIRGAGAGGEEEQVGSQVGGQLAPAGEGEAGFCFAPKRALVRGRDFFSI